MLSVTNQTSRGYLTHRSRNSKKLYLHFYYSNVLFILQAHPSSNVTSKPHAPRTQLNPPAYSFQRPPPLFFPPPHNQPFLNLFSGAALRISSERSNLDPAEATSIQPKQPRSSRSNLDPAEATSIQPKQPRSSRSNLDPAEATSIQKPPPILPPYAHSISTYHTKFHNPQPTARAPTGNFHS